MKPTTCSQVPYLSLEFRSGDLKMSLSCVKGIWKKAEEMLAESNSIVLAPGCENGSKMVKSRSGKQPHLVKCGTKISNDHLQEYIDFFRRLKNLPSVTKLLLTGLSGGIGNKGNRVS